MTEQQPERHPRLVEAGMALSSELSLDAVLQKLVESSASLAGARYAALGVVDREGTGLARFLTTGVGPEVHAAIGELPRGRGLLGVLVREATPLRLHDLTRDPRAVGFPPSHPPMRTFLGVPILLRGVVYGNLYLTEKEGGADFTQEDEELVTVLASQAAVAIENASLYGATVRWSRQLEALHEVGNALAGEIDLPRLLQLVARRLRELIEARTVLIALPRPDGTLRIEALDSEEALDAVGLQLERAGSKSGRVLSRRRSERVDRLLEDPEVDREASERLGARSGLYVPLVVREQAIGVVVAHDRRGPDPRFSEDDLRLAEVFAGRAAVAVDLSQRVARDALRRVVDAQELERRRLALELHDETGQELTSILLSLRAVEEAGSERERAEALTGVRDLVVQTLQDVRRLAVELRPRALDDFGLVPALERLAATFAERSGIRVDFEAVLQGASLPDDVATALYRVVQEALTNVVKHARATSASVVLACANGLVTATIEDDGVGFPAGRSGAQGLGIVGMRERVALLDGRLEIESAEGAGTTLVVEVPLR